MEKIDMSPYYTYKLNRRCLFCSKLIADQIHRLRKFCSREVLPDHSIKCCKDDWHSAKKSKKDPPYRAIAKHHKLMNKRIAQLFKDKDTYVKLADLNNYGIMLKRPLEYNIIDGFNVFFYIGFKIKQLDNNNYKIEKNDRIL